MCTLSVFGCPVSHLSIVTVLHLCDYALQLSIPLLPYHVQLCLVLSRVSMLTRDIDIANMSVCPSICLSVCLSVRYVPVPYENDLTYRHSFYTTRQPNHSSFTIIKHFHKIPTGSPPAGGSKYRCGLKISRFSTNKWLGLYLAND